jgi:hypothetical protein
MRSTASVLDVSQRTSSGTSVLAHLAQHLNALDRAVPGALYGRR